MTDIDEIKLKICNLISSGIGCKGLPPICQTWENKHLTNVSPLEVKANISHLKTCIQSPLCASAPSKMQGQHT